MSHPFLLLSDLICVRPTCVNVSQYVSYLPTVITLDLTLLAGLNTTFNFNKSFIYIKENMTIKKISQTLFSSENLNTYTSGDEVQASELSNVIRFTRFNNPLISYDYKCGNYIGI